MFRPSRELLLSPLLLLAACGDSSPIRSEPLAPRTGTGTGTKFTLLTAEESGLAFTNVLRKEHNYPYVNNGAGVACGDVDGDGRPDIYLVSRDGPNKLFCQTAPWRFEDVTDRAGVDGGDAWGAGATMVDVDNDGDLDIYVCNTESPNLMYVNRGDGTFDERGKALGLDHVGATEMAAFADYDRDGDLDVYLLTNRVFSGNLADEIIAEATLPGDSPRSLADLAEDKKRVVRLGDKLGYFSGQPDLLLRNDGDHFTDVTKGAGIADESMGLGVIWWDYDGDNWPDLYVANDLESPDRLYRNLGTGKFEDVTNDALPHVAYFGMGVDAGDLDNDGRLDLMVADMSSTSHFKAKWTMGDMFDTRLWFVSNSEPPQYMRNAVFLNTGLPRFMEVARLTHLASSDWTWSVKFGDLDNDGRQDVYVTNGIPRFDTNPDIKIELTGASLERQIEYARSIPPMPETNHAFRNAGDLDFEKVGAAWGLDYTGVSQGAAYADFDRDGDLDLIVNNLNEPALLYRNDSGEGHSVLIRLEGVESNRFGLGARVELRAVGQSLVRELTATRGYLSSDDPVLHFGLGNAEQIDSLQVTWPSGAVQGFGDLPADHLFTIREESLPVGMPETPAHPWFRADASNGLSFSHNDRYFDDFKAQPLLPHQLSQLGPGAAWGDANGDGLEDLWIGGAANQAGTLYMRDARNNFHKAPRGPGDADAACEDMGAVWLDVDRDGDLDLYVASGSNEWPADDRRYRDRLYLNDGKANFTRADDALPAIAESSSTVVAADFDRDGDLDLFVGGRTVPERFPEAPPSRLLRNDDGRFTDVTAELAPALLEAGMVTAALWTDADSDGWLDLVVAAHWQPVRLHRNAGGASLATPTALGPERGWWNGLTGGDLDEDGDIDYVVTNFGLNTKYKASPDHPTSVYAADFDNSGSLDIVESKFEKDTLYPVRGRSCSSNAMPFIADKFATYQDFAKAQLTDIYTDVALSQAMRVDATELRSGIYINERDGAFTFRRMPRRAQTAPGFGVVAADFDGDGTVDVCATQNFFSPEPETGRMHGGLGILLSNVKHGMTVVEPEQAGLGMRYDGVALTLADLDGDARPDLLATNNNGPIQPLVNEFPMGSFLRVRLQGMPGNPLATGARITLVTDRGRHTLETYAGSGHLGQSSRDLFVGVGAGEVRELTVRWPDGTTTTHRDPPAEGTWEISR